MHKRLLSWFVLIVGHLFMLALFTSFIGGIVELFIKSTNSIFEGILCILLIAFFFFPALLLLFSYSTGLIVMISQDIFPSTEGIRYIVSTCMFVLFYIYLFLFSDFYFFHPIPSLICMLLFSFLLGLTGYKESE